MKKAFTRESPQTGQSHKPVRVENKDNLDSRKNEEQDDKGNNITHNKKETKDRKDSREHS
ncbi:hypothetical protein SAMN05518672_10198 [Chitinophaga sp. CF118]|uniref:hypothetical protein n=1 Tax=Chitinophaga sp. CF118 TaxID=1884367 RepID=UPI0008EA49C3|nr:hypothetical protein [Chitinophaga sp. CF118]SFD02517.1 hypothetical protein SAMN05518672_10198 [Chitinophaga sp. CF118]